MLTKEKAEEILRVLITFPSDKVKEVEDFIIFLKGRHGYIDENDVWTEEDIHDLTTAVLTYAEQAS